jgi:hypothetical protein
MTRAANNKRWRAVLYIALADVAAWSARLAVNEPAIDLCASAVNEPTFSIKKAPAKPAGALA